MSYTPTPATIEYADTPQLDPFSRLRVSTPHTLFASKLLLDNQPLVWDDQQVTGASTTSTYNSASASVTLLADAAVAGRRLRQTFRRFNYQPGKGQLIFLTGVLALTGSGNAAITRRIGYYDDNNGFYFEYGSSTLNVVYRSSASGSIVSTPIAQSAWNLDKMDGTGVSGITLDVTKAQIFVIDFQWLGVGRIRFGFDIGGDVYYCHQITPANNQAIVSIANPNLPLRYEIISAGGGSGTATMMQICSTVASEAGVQEVGFPFTADTGSTLLVTGNNVLVYTLLAMQFQAGKNIASIILDSFSVQGVTANCAYRIALILNPTIAGAAITYTNVPNSAVKVGPGVVGNTVTGGTVLFSEFIQSSRNASAFSEPSQDLTLGSAIAGVSDTLVLAVQPVPALAISFSGSMNWREAV
jgi:hypothetical protein